MASSGKPLINGQYIYIYQSSNGLPTIVTQCFERWTLNLCSKQR